MDSFGGSKRKRAQDSLCEPADLHQDATGHAGSSDNHSDALLWHTAFDGYSGQGHHDTRSAFAVSSCSQVHFQSDAVSQHGATDASANQSGVATPGQHTHTHTDSRGFTMPSDGYYNAAPIAQPAAALHFREGDRSAPTEIVAGVPFNPNSRGIPTTAPHYQPGPYSGLSYRNTSTRGQGDIQMGQTPYLPEQNAAQYAPYPNYAIRISNHGPGYLEIGTVTELDPVGNSQNVVSQQQEQANGIQIQSTTPFTDSNHTQDTRDEEALDVADLGTAPAAPNGLIIAPKGKKGDKPKIKTCLRCRVQKIRCVPDDDSDECIQCQSFSKVSKKTIHHVACYRGKLTEATIFREGGLGITDRWQGTEMRDVGDRVPDDVHTIEMTQGFCDKPFVIKVVRFKPTSRDALARHWTVREGETGMEVRKKKDLEPYCFVDIWATARAFEKYIIDNAISTMVKLNTPHPLLRGTPAGNDVIQRTYIAAVEYYLGMEDEIVGPSGGKTVNPQKRLLGDLFVLWMAIRQTTGSAYICGENTLGMKPETKDETYPLFGKVSLPRMLIAQFDSINSTRMLGSYARKVLRDLESYVFRNQSTWWWTIYLCFFIFLSEASWISGDRYRHARAVFGAKYRYTVPKFVEELQDGCNNILVHWHYYNCHPWPDPKQPATRHKHFMGELTSAQHDLVMETMMDPRIQKQLAVWKYYKENNGKCMYETTVTGDAKISVQKHPALRQINEVSYVGPQMRFDWDNPCYWVAQMFEEKWSPHPTYQREYNQ